MNEEGRLTPEEFLRAAEQEENQKNRGKLKIFLGMAAGVGKTYAMLEEAQNLKNQGVDVVVGIVDTHGRPETALLLKDLVTIPEKTVYYKDKAFKELDLDAVLEKRPALVLVDEFAHTNIPGGRHAKRWQDILEILDNGIDVYTTLNVQHIESLNDLVQEITGVSVRETVPDLIIEKARSIRLVDLSPDELLRRLQEGKVYFPDQSKIAALNFFQRERLTALREIVLRYAADKVDRDLRGMIAEDQRVIEWKPREKFLVAVSHSPMSQKLIRTTRRLASTFDAPWVALHVNDGSSLNEKERELLDKNLALARDLGAEVVTVNDPNIAEGIQRIARQRGITQIIIGRPPDFSFLSLFRGTLLDKLSTNCKDIDIHVIRQERFSAYYKKNPFKTLLHKKYSDYLIVFIVVALIAALNWLALPLAGYRIVGVIFLIGILALSLFFKKGPVFFASLLYAFIWGVFFVPPSNEFALASNEDMALLMLYALTAITTGILVDRARENKEMLIKSEEATQTLYEMTRQIALAPTLEEMLKFVRERLGKILHGKVEFLLKTPEGELIMDDSEHLLSNEKEKNAAIWAYENEKEAGWSTDTLPSVKNLFIPLKGLFEILGLLIYQPKQNKLLSIEDKNFLYTISQLLSNYLERTYVQERVKQHDQLIQVEKIHKTILERLSHAFKRPILNTKNAINELKNKLRLSEKKILLEDLEHLEMLVGIFIKIVGNISAMAQLSEGMIPLKKELHDMRELITDCCENLKKSFKDHTLQIEAEKHLPLVPFDYYLIEIVLHNLLLNAIQYSPPKTLIQIKVKTQDAYLVLSIINEGHGIPEDQLDIIFEKFYRHPEVATPGMGLGLAIARTIAEIHQGFIKAESELNKGATFSLYLPLK